MQTRHRGILFPEESRETSSSNDDEDEIENEKKPPLKKVVHFCCFSSIEKAEKNDLFVLDTDGTSNINVNTRKSSFEKKDKIKSKMQDADSSLGETTKELLSKSIIKPGFEKYLGEGHIPKSWRALKRERKMDRERTKGDDWYNLPAGEMTEERERDLEIIQMRDSLDSKARYRKNDRHVLPKYFQVGFVVETKADFYSSRIPKKLRKKTIVEELLADVDLQTKQRKKYQEIKAREAITKRGAFRHSSYPRKKKQI
uniref:Fcf2 pre-rRNA processing C-terminal domain-containing protein n=1 Tax=Setaria digitata TaxID=48799 RepID=A0A915Q2N9_9BILA